MLVALALCGACSRPPEPRNLLVISIDTLRADHLGVYGYGKPTSPAIDAFAAGGQVFERAYGSSSWTLPSLATLFTSQPLSAHGARTNTTRLGESWTTLAEDLSSAGFKTAAVANHIYLAHEYGLSQGFDDYDDELVMKEGEDSHMAVTSPSVTSKGLAWLAQHGRSKDQRWFLWLHYFDPHSIYKRHAGLTEQFGEISDKMVRYDGEIAYTDQALAQLLAGMGELGVDRDTVIVLVADHGEAFGEHGSVGHRNDLYEESIRVPMIFSGPGVEPGRSPSPVGLVDVFPTVYELLELVPPAQLSGRSLAPLLRGEALAPLAAVAELGATGVPQYAALIGERWKLLVDRKAGSTELYDLQADPGETHDLSEESPALTIKLRSTLNKRMDVLAQRQARKRAAAEDIQIELDEETRHALDNLGYAGDE